MCPPVASRSVSPAPASWAECYNEVCRHKKTCQTNFCLTTLRTSRLHREGRITREERMESVTFSSIRLLTVAESAWLLRDTARGGSTESARRVPRFPQGGPWAAAHLGTRHFQAVRGRRGAARRRPRSDARRDPRAARRERRRQVDLRQDPRRRAPADARHADARRPAASRSPSPIAAQKLGITLIHQEPISFPDLSVAENLVLGPRPAAAPLGRVPWAEMTREARRLMDLLGVRST